MYARGIKFGVIMALLMVLLVGCKKEIDETVRDNLSSCIGALIGKEGAGFFQASWDENEVRASLVIKLRNSYEDLRKWVKERGWDEKMTFRVIGKCALAVTEAQLSAVADKLPEERLAELLEAKALIEAFIASANESEAA